MKYRNVLSLAVALAFSQSTVAQQEKDTAAEQLQPRTIDLPLLGMTISDQEKKAIEDSIGFARQISEKAQKINGLPYRRDAHAKATGCVRATFSVNGIYPMFPHISNTVYSAGLARRIRRGYDSLMVTCWFNLTPNPMHAVWRSN